MSSTQNIVIIGGGVSAVSASEELIRALAQDLHDRFVALGLDTDDTDDDAYSEEVESEVEQTRTREIEPMADFPRYTISILHNAPFLHRITSSITHTERLEEVTSLSSECARDFLRRIQRQRIPKYCRGNIQVKMVLGQVVQVHTKEKSLLYEPLALSDHTGASCGGGPSSAVQLLSFDKLIICTGARPKLFLNLPPSQHIPEQIITIRDGSSLTRLASLLSASAESSSQEQANRAKKVCIVGNGGIALELVHALRTNQLSAINTSTTVATSVSAPEEAKPDEDDAPYSLPPPPPAPAVPLPPLDVSWIMKDEFMGNTFLDHMASAFLMPELFPEKEPDFTTHSDSQPSGSDHSMQDTHASHASDQKHQQEALQQMAYQEEEKIVSVEHGHHVRTTFSTAGSNSAASASVSNSISSSQSATASPDSTSSNSKLSGPALGPNWLNQLFLDTNIPKYIFERQRIQAEKEKEAAARAGKQHDGMDVDSSATSALPAFQLSLEFKSEVAEVQQLGPEAQYPIALVLTNGKRVECDLVVSATGVTPNTDFLRNSNSSDSRNDIISEQLELDDRGAIIIDEYMHTSVKDIYAAGDCCTLRFTHSFLEENKHLPLATSSSHSNEQSTGLSNNVFSTVSLSPCLYFSANLWSHAKVHGMYAARSCSGLYEEELSELKGFNFMLFAHTTSIFGKKIVLLGLYNLQGFSLQQIRELKQRNLLKTLVRCKLKPATNADGSTASGSSHGEEFIKLHMINNRIVGAVLIGDSESETMDLEETFENLMLNQANLEEYGDFLNDVDVDLADYFD